jgi:serine/threonine-protein kinase RsbT
MSTQPQKEMPIRSESDIVSTRRTVREVAQGLGFGITDVTRIVTAASELARNVVLYAGSGVLRWRELARSGSVGVELTLEDTGPGIASIALPVSRRRCRQGTRQAVGWGWAYLEPSD